MRRLRMRVSHEETADAKDPQYLGRAMDGRLD
jgi:hypothetical protein